MRSLVVLSLVGGLTAIAWARPDGNNDRPPPPSMMRQEVQMRMPVDGRGDTMGAVRESRPDPWRVDRPQAERPVTGTQRPDLPLKSEVLQKAHPGDQRDMAPKPQALDARAQPQQPAGDRMGRPVEKPALPIKTEITMKQQHGDNRDGASTAPAAGSAAKSAAAAKSAGAARPSTATMTSHDRQMLCKMAGLCLPQAHATDDVEDKTE